MDGELERIDDVLKERLRKIDPIWEGYGLKLYRSLGDFRVVNDTRPHAHAEYIGITPDGKVVDVVGNESPNDVKVAMECVDFAGNSRLGALLRRRYGDQVW